MQKIQALDRGVTVFEEPYIELEREASKSKPQ